MAATTFTFTFQEGKLNGQAVANVLAAIKTISPTLKPTPSDAIEVKLTHAGWEAIKVGGDYTFYNPLEAAIADNSVSADLFAFRIPVYGREQYITLNKDHTVQTITTEDEVVIAYYEQFVRAFPVAADGVITVAKA